MAFIELTKPQNNKKEDFADKWLGEGGMRGSNLSYFRKCYNFVIKVNDYSF